MSVEVPSSLDDAAGFEGFNQRAEGVATKMSLFPDVCVCSVSGIAHRSGQIFGTVLPQPAVAKLESASSMATVHCKARDRAVNSYINLGVRWSHTAWSAEFACRNTAEAAAAQGR